MTLRKIDLMHRLFGICEGHTCRECDHLVKFEHRTRNYTKCEVYGVTQSEASDWAQRYLACGMFNKPWNDKQIMRLVRPTQKDKEEMQNMPIDGQISMEV